MAAREGPDKVDVADNQPPTKGVKLFIIRCNQHEPSLLLIWLLLVLGDDDAAVWAKHRCAQLCVI